MNDLDNALRAMLQERAGDISTLPAQFTELPGPDVLAADPARPHHHRARWAALAAAAAIVAGIAGVTVALRDRDSHHSLPATPQPNSVSPSPNPKLLAACPTTLPAAWTAALNSGSNLGASSAVPLAVSTSGTVLATRDFGDKRDVVLVEPNTAPHVISTVPSPDQKQVMTGAIEGKWALVSVMALPRTANGVIPTVSDIVLVDTTTDSARTVAHLDGSDPRSITTAALQDGHVYWDVLPHFNSPTGTIQDYAISSGTQRTLATGQIAGPVADALKVSWGDAPSASIKSSRRLPAVIEQVIRDPQAAGTLSTDGSSYAWIDGAARIGWWAPGKTSPTYLKIPGELPGSAERGTVLVAGPYVFDYVGRTTDTTYLVDMRTGARAETTTPLRFSGHGIFANYGALGDPKGQPTPALILDTATLPGLHC